jgi:DNA-binding Lrp family transcriptional regulator
MDRADVSILNALQNDGSLSNVALAEVVNLSPSQCSRRRNALEQEGVIAGYHARINPRSVGFGLRAITRVNLSGHGKEESFLDFLNEREEVRAAHSASGDADYILEIYVRDLDAFASFIHDALLPHPQVGHVRSEIVLRTVKNSPGLPIR